MAADWDNLEARARAGVPEHRRGWFQSMIRQGREAEGQGREALAARCRERIEAELSALASVRSAPEASSAVSTAPDKVAAFAALALRREGAVREGILALLDRHADRLPVAERDAVREALRDAGDAHLGGMRRRLVDRLLRAARYRRRAGLFAGWKPSPRGADAAGGEARPEGPYNDYRALEETLRRVAASNPEWVAEFLDVYGEMRGTERKYGEARGKK
jgi:hypothetical protein